MEHLYSSWLPRPLAALGLLLITAGTAQAQNPAASFAAATVYGTSGSNPISIAVADVNGDGNPDLFTANYGNSTVGVLLGTGNGTFQAATTYSANGNDPISIAVADVNGDGQLDLLTANTGNHTVGVLLGNGNGTFQPIATYATGTNSFPYSIAVADVNGDGKPDLLTTNFILSTVGVLLGNGNGSFQAATTYTTGGNSNPYSIAVADVNGDGQLDLLTANNGNNTVGVLLSNGNGTFQAITTYSTGDNSFPYNIAVADVNGDGKLDLLTANNGNNTAGVLLGNGNGTFQVATTYGTSGNNPIGIAVADVNGDGQLDLLTTNRNSNTAGVLLGNGNGTFQVATTYGTGGSNPMGIAVADVNRDGQPDLLTANFNSNTVGVLLNTVGYAAPTLTSINPPSAAVGRSVTLTGTNLTGATAVSFNGTVATTFVVVNSSTITATVPPRATSGNVTVATPSGTTGGLLFTVTYPDLVVDTPTTIPAGIYNSITVTKTGVGTLAGDVTVATSLTVQSGGTLIDGCAVIRGAGSFTLAAGATLGSCAAQGLTTSGATGTVQVTGARSFSPDASYVYNSSAAQVTGDGLPSQVRNLTTTNDNSVTLSAATSVSQVLTVSGIGNLVLNGNALTLLSSSVGTALVVNASAGRVVGNTVVVQRYIDGSLNQGAGYRHYSVPVVGSTVADFTTTDFTPVVNLDYNASATPGTVRPFPTFYLYNQNRLASASNNLSNFDKGWFSPSTLNYLLYPGFGYCVNIDAEQVVDFVGGLVSTPSTTIFLERTTGTTAADGGWVLLGNPYASPLDLSLVAAADRRNVEAATYVIQSTGQYAGGYRAYVNGVSTSASNSPLLALGQGFFVRVSAGQTSGTFTFRNAQRVTTYASQAAFQRTTADARPTVRLELVGAGRADTWVAYAEAGATPEFDGAFDAGKLPNTTGLNLSSVAGTDNLAIDGRSTFTTATTLPLAVGVPAAGTYTLTTAALDNLPGGLTAYLRDAQTGQTTKLIAGTSYSFRVNATEAQALILGRFTVVFSPQTALATTPFLSAEAVSVYPNPAHSSFAVRIPGMTGARAVQAELINTLGQVVHRQLVALPTSGTSFSVPTAELVAGVYVLRLQAGDTILTKRVVVH